MKNEKVKDKFNNVTTTIKFLTFMFLCMENDVYFARKHNLWENVLYTITFLVTFF